jgi:hypothetical protein
MPAMRIFRLLRDFDKPTVHQRAAHPAGNAGRQPATERQQAATSDDKRTSGNARQRNQRRSGSGH